MAKEGKLKEENDKELYQDTGFATISETLAAKTTKKLKSMFLTQIFAPNHENHFFAFTFNLKIELKI